MSPVLSPHVMVAVARSARIAVTGLGVAESNADVRSPSAGFHTLTLHCAPVTIVAGCVAVPGAQWIACTTKSSQFFTTVASVTCRGSRSVAGPPVSVTMRVSGSTARDVQFVVRTRRSASPGSTVLILWRVRASQTWTLPLMSRASTSSHIGAKVTEQKPYGVDESPSAAIVSGSRARDADQKRTALSFPALAMTRRASATVSDATPPWCAATVRTGEIVHRVVAPSAASIARRRATRASLPSVAPAVTT
mmetsp:Transcript_46241/g.142613  ORF Transcript_46241/g.142613 Transcript_46241/m.142613 type:complete len:250 (+) Transcript_46241:1659-2408(+)